MNKMNIEDINRRINLICEMMINEDHETAHSLEDTLFHDFILHICETGTEEQKKLASLVLKTKNIEFKRWCA